MNITTTSNLSNPDLEAKVLGAVIAYHHAAEVVFSVIGPGAFYHYNTLANIIHQMYLDKKPIDIITVFEIAKKEGISHNEVTNVATEGITPANIEYYSRILFQYALGRNLAQVAKKTQDDILTGLDPFEALESLKNALKIELPAQNKNSYQLSELNTLEKIQKTITEGYRSFVLPWKNDANYDIEFEYGNMVIIAAGPSVGKTAFMLNTVFHLAQKNIPVCIFNFESGMDKLKYRILSMYTGIAAMKLKKGMISSHDMAQVEAALSTIDSMPIYANERSRDIIGMELAIRELNSKGVNLFFIDNMSNVTLPNADRMDLRIGAFLKELTRLKKELNITIVLLVHRARENDSNRKNKMASLRNSGEYEQDADQIIIMDALEGNEVEVNCVKDRDGATWSVILEFDKSIQQFKNRNYTDAVVMDYNNFNPVADDTEIVF
jgi:replicative DNA helicase